MFIILGFLVIIFLAIVVSGGFSERTTESFDSNYVATDTLNYGGDSTETDESISSHLDNSGEWLSLISVTDKNYLENALSLVNQINNNLNDDSYGVADKIIVDKSKYRNIK